MPVAFPIDWKVTYLPAWRERTGPDHSVFALGLLHASTRRRASPALPGPGPGSVPYPRLCAPRFLPLQRPPRAGGSGRTTSHGSGLVLDSLSPCRLFISSRADTGRLPQERCPLSASRQKECPRLQSSAGRAPAAPAPRISRPSAPSLSSWARTGTQPPPACCLAAPLPVPRASS